MMKPLRIQDIARAIGAEFGGEGQVSAVSTDTRNLPEGCLFVALRGEKFDGHAFIDQALADGAAYAVAEETEGSPAGRVLKVKDTRAAYLAIANLYRNSLDVHVVGVTGSVGKTTTKEMVACALSAGFPTLKNEANLNNEIGLPQTILRLTKEHRAAVLEMGMDGPGQIAPLSLCAQPDIGIVTNIGVSHLEAMGTRENILREKLSIGEGMADGAPLILCGDDDLLVTAPAVLGGRLRILYYGIDNPNCVVRADRIKEFSTHTTFEIVYDGNRFDATIPSMGRHNVYNALAAFLAAVCLQIPPQDAIASLKGYRPAGMRQNIVKHGPFTVVEDCYNASPDSMKAAMATLGKLECDGRRIAVLSDMLELGAIERQAHYDAGALAARSNVDILLCTGPLSQEYVRGAKDAGMASVHYFADKDSLFDWLKAELRSGDVAWFKASRGMQLEQVIARVYKEC